MSVEQAGNQVRVVVNARLYPSDARALAASISAAADAAEATSPPPIVSALTDDIQAAVAGVPNAAGNSERAAMLKAVASYLAQAGYTKPAAKP